MLTEDSKNKKQDRRKLTPSEGVIKKRSEGSKRAHKENPQLAKNISEKTKKSWMTRSKTIGLELKNINTGEVVILDKPLRAWAIERGLSYRSLHLLVRKSVKTAAGGWYIADTDPTPVCRKCEKRKPLTQEQKDKKSRAALIKSGLIGPDDEIPEVKNYFNSLDNKETAAKTTSSRLRRLVVKGDPFITRNGWYNKEEALDTIRGVCEKCKIVFCSISGFNSHKRTHVNDLNIEEFCHLEIRNKFDEGKEKREIVDPTIFTRGVDLGSIKREKFITGIYAIINKVNGKRYIGSSVDVVKRWEDHAIMLRGNRHHSIHLQSAWNKGNPEDFEFVILEEVFEKEKMYEIEQASLDSEVKTVGKENIYNTTFNVLGPPNLDKLKHPVLKLDRKTREVLGRYESISDAARDTPKATEVCIKKVCKGKHIHSGGFAWRYADDSVSLKYKTKDKKAISLRKTVYCLSLDKRRVIEKYGSITEAAEEIGIPRRSIVACLRGYRKTAGGFCFTEDHKKTNKKNLNGAGIECLECGNRDSETLKGLSVHLQFVHKMRSIEYIVKNYYNGKRPGCKVKNCKELPRYHSMNGKSSFKEYCRHHSSIACSEGGKVGGRFKRIIKKNKKKLL